MVLDSPVLVRHLLGDLMSDTGIMRVFQLRILCCIVGGLLYLLSPLDILPEALFGWIGFMDDILILLMLFVYLSTIYHRIMLNRAHDPSWMDSDAENEEEEQAEDDGLAEQAMHTNLIDHANTEQRLTQQRPLNEHQYEESPVVASLIRRVRDHVQSLSPILEQDLLVGSTVLQNSQQVQDSLGQGDPPAQVNLLRQINSPARVHSSLQEDSVLEDGRE